jgi:hypothetical protein
MNPLLSWLIPPVMGAGIGYVTNAVAIKMLFRPLRELRFLGVRLPFTPGILPRQRRKLADNIGRMVDRELLTAEVLRARLRRPEVREGLLRAVGAWSEKVLALSPASLAASLPGSAGGFLSSLGRDLVKSPGFGLALRGLGEALAEHGKRRGVLKKSLRGLLGDEAAAGLEQGVRGWLEGFTVLVLEGEGPGDFIRSSLENFYPRGAARFVGLLEGGEMRRILEVQGHIFLSRVMMKLNAFQRFFISAGQYDRTLQDRMPEIINDLIDQVRGLLGDENTRSRIVKALDASIRRLLAGGETRRRISRFASERFALLLDRPLGDIFPAAVLDKAAELFGRIPALFPAAGEEGAASFVPVLLEKLLEKMKDAPGTENLGGLLSLGGDQKKALDGFIAGKILALADEQTGPLLESVNVRVLVRDRIDALDMVQVERIVLDVMASQLKWINIFGAILGALIGLCQPVLAFFTG